MNTVISYSTQRINTKLIYFDEFGLNAMYLLIGEHHAAVIDTGTGSGNFYKMIRKYTTLPLYVILTHGHVDHAGGIGAFRLVFVHSKDFDRTLSISSKDRREYAQIMHDTGASCLTQSGIDRIKDNKNQPDVEKIDEKTVFDLGGRTLRVFHTPGHTAGSICLWDEEDKYLFSGDSFNPMQIIDPTVKGRSRTIKAWVVNGEKCFEQCGKPNLILGGHGILTEELVQQTLLCGENILQGNVKFIHAKRHIFDTDFADYKDVCLCYGKAEDLIANQKA